MRSTFKKIIFFTLVAIVLVASVRIAKAADFWVDIVGINNENLETTVTADQIIQTGTHHAAGDNAVRYRTIGYYMTSNKYNLFQPMSSTYNASITKVPYTFTPGASVQTGDKITMTYYIDLDTFVRKAAKLGITGDYIYSHGVASVYTHSVFQSYAGNTIRHSPIWGYQEFLDAEPWSAATQDTVKSFFNYEFKLTAKAIYTINVVAVDDDNNPLTDGKTSAGATVPAVLHTQKAIVGEDVTYNPGSTYNTIIKDGSNYKIKGWYFSYTDRKTNTIKNGSMSGGMSVSFESPDVKPGTTLITYLVYEQEAPTNYYAKTVAVTSTGTEIATLKTIQTVKFGDIYNYTITTPKTINSKSYVYQNNCYLKYKNTSGNMVTVSATMTTDSNGRPQIKHKMPVGYKDSDATFYVVYGLNPITPTPTPTGTATPTAVPTPTPSVLAIVVPTADSASMEYTDVIATGSILADNKGIEKFTTKQGIPTTESLYGKATATNYIVGYDYVKNVGTKTYSVPVKKTYTWSWTDPTPLKAGQTAKTLTNSRTVTKYYNVTRAYGYWEIIDIGFYRINNVTMQNYALVDGSITLIPNASLYTTPTMTAYHSASENYHLSAPAQVSSGITLTQDISNGSSSPVIPSESYEYIALTQTGQITVRSDSVTWNGQTVMDGTPTSYEAPTVNKNLVQQCSTVTPDNTLYKNNQIIEATKNNGEYASLGNIVYTATVAYRKPDTILVPVEGINKVIIHTPVLCDASISADNDKWVQLINPTSAVQLVLDKDTTLNDFTVQVSNTGTHSPRSGYYYRDLAWSLRDTDVSYMAMLNGLVRNEVKFPFDVYRKIGNDNNLTNDQYISSGTWITIGQLAPNFYLPMWVPEGVYSVAFRSVAVNVRDRIDDTEAVINSDMLHYVATDTVKVEVSGRMYGLTMYDVTDYPLWKEAFRVPNSNNLKINAAYTSGVNSVLYNQKYAYDYKVGTCDQYGNSTGRNAKYTFPLVNNSHPKYITIGILKTGYMTRFKLTTTGEMYSKAAKVVVQPTFYFVDADGKNRKQVDLYYSEEIGGKNKNLVKVGSTLDLTNIKSYQTSDIGLCIPTNELKQTALINGESYGKYIYHRAQMFTFGKINLTSTFRTFINNSYLAQVKGLSSYSDVTADNISDSLILKTKQEWYGQYYLPNNVHAVVAGYDVIDYASKKGVSYKESFWLTDGYIIVNYNIYTVDQYGKQRLSYTNSANYLNKGNCSMWIKENPAITKKDNENKSFTFFAGDYIMYYANKKMGDDYHSGAVY